MIWKEAVRAYLKISSGIAQDYYPELLGQMIIVNAPWMFSCLWAVAKLWIDEKTKQKIQIYGGGFKKDLLKIIPEEKLPDFLGGTVTGHPKIDCQWNDYKKFCWESGTFYFDEKFKKSDPIEVARINPMEKDSIEEFTTKKRLGMWSSVDELCDLANDTSEDVVVGCTRNGSLMNRRNILVGSWGNESLEVPLELSGPFFVLRDV